MKFILLLCLILSVVAAVDYTVTNNAASTPGGIRFSTEVGDDDTVITLMDSATNFIWKTFQNTDPVDNKALQLVPLYVLENLEMFNGNPPAYTLNGKIYFNAGYLQRFSGDLLLEFTGILYHEMAHVWQWNGNLKSPSGLTEGIADYITLKADYARSYWPKEPGQGNTWDEGYEITAFFLDYCNNYYKTIMIDDVPADLLENGFVAELND